MAPFAIRRITLLTITRITSKTIARITVQPISWITRQPIPRIPHLRHRDPMLRERLNRVPHNDQQRRQQRDQAHQSAATNST
ncbi:MAG: hypothetical protein IPO18_12745 [bacterium]|nr:hypothetical protein [bacterium]